MKIPAIKKLPSGNFFCQLRIDGKSIPITDASYDMVYAKAVAIKTGLIKAKREPAKMTVGSAVDEYIENRSSVLSPATVRDYKQIRRVWFQPLMDMQIDRLTKEIIQRHVNDESKKGYAPKTVKNAFMLIKAAISDKTDVNLTAIKLPAPKKKIPQPYTAEQLQKLFKAVEGTNIEVPVLLAAWLSLRRSEIVALTWDCVGEDTITVKNAMVLDENMKLVSKGTKTYNSARVIPCPRYIIDKINQLPHNGERLFTLHPNNYWDRLQTVCKQNGLPPIGLHTLRHTNASVMAMLGIGDKYAMERGGWSTNHVMQSVYQHIMTAGKVQTAQKIDDYFYALIPDSGSENS